MSEIAVVIVMSLLSVLVFGSIGFLFWKPTVSFKPVAIEVKTEGEGRHTTYKITARGEKSSFFRRWVERASTPVVRRALQSIANGTEFWTHTNNGRKVKAVVVGYSKRGYTLKTLGHPGGGTFRRRIVIAA